MKLFKAVGMAVLVGAGSAALATDVDEPTTHGVSKASAWIGMDVKDKAGNDVGEVKDLVVDWKRGTVTYAIVAVEKWLNIDSKLVAIEPSRLLAAADGDHVIVQMTEAEVNATPGFDDDTLPTAAAVDKSMTTRTTIAQTPMSQTPATTTTTSPRTAQPTGTGTLDAARDFDKLDQDRDGYLSKTEAQNRVEKYDDADRNEDGRLDRGEFSAIEMNAAKKDDKDHMTQ